MVMVKNIAIAVLATAVLYLAISRKQIAHQPPPHPAATPVAATPVDAVEQKKPVVSKELFYACAALTYKRVADLTVHDQPVLDQCNALPAEERAKAAKSAQEYLKTICKSVRQLPLEDHDAQRAKLAECRAAGF
jgi:hypothetical protein